ncbi:hypothetical protein EST35_0431 [Pseudomonas phage vB_PaeM_PA5oct]|uniref:Uncharacterized protein n=1 Tax=Pseudomonas phage vB_PaeM_PA5oct TaxID=2163605 RepID=A0A4Y5JVA7_9CAUD|nr:hypothetical protein PQE65_gp066 [Pseudomonas phage vB_PaeM_PA5oct]QCG76299.1 hypothetical protein EST35_0431 [Pseudomonas phage vB_PaeM_PA5oct]
MANIIKMKPVLYYVGDNPKGAFLCEIYGKEYPFINNETRFIKVNSIFYISFISAKYTYIKFLVRYRFVTWRLYDTDIYISFSRAMTSVEREINKIRGV